MREQFQSRQDVILQMTAASSQPAVTSAAAGSATQATGVVTAAATRSAVAAAAGWNVTPNPGQFDTDESDEFDIGDNEDASPFDMQSFASGPLGCLLEPKLKAKIWAMQFVVLELLVSDSTYQTT